MMAKKIDFKAVQESRGRLDKLAREHPELIDKSIPEAERRRQWEETLRGVEMTEKNAFTIKEAAERLACHPDTLRRAIKAGKLKAAKLGTDTGKGKGYRISRADLQEYYRSLGGGELFSQ